MISILMYSQIMASVEPTTLPIGQGASSLINLPVELVEAIVSLLNRKDILNARLAHPEIAAKSYKAFAHTVLGSRPTFLANKPSFRRLAAICDHPEISRFVKYIGFDIGCPGLVTHEYFDSSRVGRALSKLPNLKTLDLGDCLSSISHCSSCSRGIYNDTRVPTLQKLSMSLIRIDAHTLARLIVHHQSSLKVIELKCVTVTAGRWPTVLEAIIGLEQHAKVEIFAPYQRSSEVSFVPEKNDPDAAFVRVVETKRRKSHPQYSYRIKSVHDARTMDGISRAIQCMLRSYRLEH